MSEAPVNSQPINQLAAQWLRQAKDPPEPERLYLAQLAQWGLDQGLVVGKPLATNQPNQDDLMYRVGALLAAGPQAANRAFRWILSNPNLEYQEQKDYLEQALTTAGNPLAAASLVLETVCEVMAVVHSQSQE